MTTSLEPGRFHGCGAHGEVDAVVLVGVQLVDDRERGGETVQLERVGGEDAQVPCEPFRHVGVVAPSELEVPDHEPGVVEADHKPSGLLEEDACLVAAGGGDVDGGVLDAEEMVDGERREQRRLSLAAREQDNELTLVAGGSLRDQLLERLQLESHPFAEQGELHRGLRVELVREVEQAGAELPGLRRVHRPPDRVPLLGDDLHDHVCGHVLVQVGAEGDVDATLGRYPRCCHRAPGRNSSTSSRVRIGPQRVPAICAYQPSFSLTSS